MLSVGIRFNNGPKRHYVSLPEDAQIPALNTIGVVETRRGLELAKVCTDINPDSSEEDLVGKWQHIATQKDLATQTHLEQKANDLKWLLRARAREKIPEVKIVLLEFVLDESVLIVNYHSTNSVSMRPLLSDAAQHTSARIEFVQVGQRDQSRMMGTLGRCGDSSCSSTWMQSYGSTTIRMARDQQLPLNPNKISGACGRLMCCLQYEHELYKILLKDMPKRGRRACHTDTGQCGHITKTYPLTKEVDVRLDDGGYATFNVENIEILEKQQKKQRPTE